MYNIRCKIGRFYRITERPVRGEIRARLDDAGFVPEQRPNPGAESAFGGSLLRKEASETEEKMFGMRMAVDYIISQS